MTDHLMTLPEIAALCDAASDAAEKATPGEWSTQDAREMDGSVWIVAQHPEVGDVSIASVRPGCEEAEEIGNVVDDAAFIARARSDVPALVAACRWLMGEVAHEHRQYIEASGELDQLAAMLDADSDSELLTVAAQLKTRADAAEAEKATLVAACRQLVAELTTARAGFEEANRDTYAAERQNVEAAARISELLAENAKLRDENDVLRDERLRDENLALCNVEIARLRDMLRKVRAVVAPPGRAVYVADKTLTEEIDIILAKTKGLRS